MARTLDLTRRDFVTAGLSALAAPLVPACLGPPQKPPIITGPQLLARPGTPTITPVSGASSLGLGSDRDGMLYVPQSYDPATPMPLFVALHGAGGSHTNWPGHQQRAETRGMILLAVDSRETTWDALLGAYGADVLFIDRALEHTFARCRVDPSHLALAGFSDGASYALSLGMNNADLFSHLVAYSPGLIVSGIAQARTLPIFVSHGTQDAVIPVENSRTFIVPTLRGLGNDVTYREFDGPHTTTSEIVDGALDWFFA